MLNINKMINLKKSKLFESLQRLLLLLFLSIPLILIGQTNSKHNYVKSYYKKDGTFVSGHYKTMPNNTMLDNFSTKGNINPYTGKLGSIIPENYSRSSNYIETSKYQEKTIDAMNILSKDFGSIYPNWKQQNKTIIADGFFINEKDISKKALRHVNNMFLGFYFNIFNYYYGMDGIYDKLLLLGFEKIKFVTNEYSYSVSINKLKQYEEIYEIDRIKRKQKIDSLLKEGFDNFKSNKFEEASVICSEIIELDPKNKDAYMIRAISKYHLENFHEALLEINEVIEIYPNDDFSYFWRGKIQLKFKEYNSAFVDFSQAIEINPKDANSYHQRAFISYVINNEITKACLDWEKAKNLGHEEALEMYNINCN